MVNKERNDMPSPEIGPKEIYVFEKKVSELTNNRKIGLHSITWSSKYQKETEIGNKRIEVISIQPDGFMAADVEEPFFTDERNHMFTNYRSFQSDRTEDNKRKMVFHQRIIEYDPHGNEIVVTLPFVTVDEKGRPFVDLELLKKRREEEESLGLRTFTKDHFEEIMPLLNSLTPEDEVYD